MYLLVHNSQYRESGWIVKLDVRKWLINLCGVGIQHVKS